VHCLGISLSKVILFKEQCVLCMVFPVQGHHSEEECVPCVGISPTKVVLFKEQCVLCRVFLS
jgi:predicted DCC family thiol-disulfide oxidoreductase YuxK